MSERARHHHHLFPFSSLAWDQLGAGLEQYYDIRWEAEWGPFAAGSCAPGLTINYGTGILAVHAEGVASEVPFVALPGRSEDYWPTGERL